MIQERQGKDGNKGNRIDSKVQPARNCRGRACRRFHCNGWDLRFDYIRDEAGREPLFDPVLRFPAVRFRRSKEGGNLKIMRCIRFLLMLSSAMTFALPLARGAAQTADTAPYRMRTLPKAAEVASPFAIDAPGTPGDNVIRFLHPEAISAQDRAVIRGAMPALASRAAFAGFNLQQGTWTYRQIACPVLTEDVLLQYSRNDGPGDLSRFSAVIPRNKQGAVRVLPILRRSFSSFTPAPESPLTIAAFNRMRASQQSNTKPDWLMTGLCYAALAGARVALTPSEQGHAAIPFPGAVPFLQIDKGLSTVRFTNVERPTAPKEWSLTFDPQGRLVHVEVSSIPPLQAKNLH